MTFAMNNAGIRISVVGNDLDVRSDRPLTAPQFLFIQQHKARLLTELNTDNSLGFVDVVNRIASENSQTEDGDVTIDPEFFINSACQGLPVDSDWVHQYVVDDQDSEDIKKGDLPKSCLRAHIEYQLEDQLTWHELRKQINNQFDISKQQT